MTDILIIGSGPAGLTAAIYGCRAMLDVVVAEKDYMGTGQISTSERVDNYPGLYGIGGFELGEKFRSQAQELGAGFYEGEATGFEYGDGVWKTTFKDGNVIESKTVVYAAGTSYRHLGVPGDNKQRISYCAMCDGFFYTGKTVAVVGGGDTALGDAIYLSKMAKTVYLIHRRDEFRASRSLQKAVSGIKNIVPVMQAKAAEVLGETNAEGIRYVQNGEEKELRVDGIFTAIGSVPNTWLLEGVCELDKDGYVVAGEDCKTSADGFFAAGDVRTTPLRQVITAAADGARAATSAEEFIRQA